jgi:WD40 repeat protein
VGIGHFFDPSVRAEFKLCFVQDISALAWSPNGNYLVSAGKDLRVVVWDYPTKAPVI